MADVQQYSVSIKFKTEGAEGSEEKIKKLEDQLAKLKQSSKKMNLSKNIGFSKAGSAAAKFGSILKGVAGAAIFSKVGKGLFNMTNQTADYIETVNLFRASMGDAADQATEFIDKAEKLLGMDPKKMMDSMASFQNLSEGFGIASDRAYIMSKNLTQLSGDLSSFANISFEDAQKKLMSGFSGQVQPLRKYGIALDQASLQETAYSLGLDQKVKNMTRAQKTELIYYQIMKSTQKMQGDLGRSLLSPANALRVMQTEFARLGRAVGSIFIPIMMRIIPVVRAVTQALTSAAQAIARFFGFEMSDFNADLSSVGNMLQGVGDGIDGIGDSAEGTAKKMNKMLMPFDELNNITSSTGTGSGSGVGAGGISGGTLGIELPQYDMFASMDQSINGIIEKGNWNEIGKTIGRKINQALRMIPWEDIKKAAGNLGTNIAEFLNGGIRGTNWKLVGGTLAEGVNTAFSFLKNFLTTTDFETLGIAVSDTVNGFFDKVEWDKVGQTLSAGTEGALDFIVSAIDNFDTNKLNNAIEKMLSNINWGKIFNKIGQYMQRGIAYSPIFTIPKMLVAIFQSAVNSIIDMLNKIQIKVPEWVPGIGGSQWGFDIDHVDFVSSYDKAVATILKSSGDAREELQNNTKTVKKGIFSALSEIQNKVPTYGNDTMNNYNSAVSSQTKNTDGIMGRFNQILEKGLNQSDKSDDWGTNTINNYNVAAASATKTTQGIFSKINEAIEKGLNQAGISSSWGSETISNYNSGVNSQTSTSSGIFSRINKAINDGLNQSDKSSKWGSDTLGNYNSGLNSKKNSVFDRFTSVKDKIRNSLNQSGNSSSWGRSTIGNYENGIDSKSTPVQRVLEKIKSFTSILASSNSYTWGQDMVQGFMNGIDSRKGSFIDVIHGMSRTISDYMHFSRPEKGPLRDYETWMPDMIEGLSSTMIQALPKLSSATMQMSKEIADSLSNISMPKVEDFSVSSELTTELIGNIENQSTIKNPDQISSAISTAAYSGVSKALMENQSNQKQQIIQVNVGNKELYKGYGQYRDEQSNMLGVNLG